MVRLVMTRIEGWGEILHYWWINISKYHFIIEKKNILDSNCNLAFILSYEYPFSGWEADTYNNTLLRLFLSCLLVMKDKWEDAESRDISEERDGEMWRQSNRFLSTWVVSST